MYEKNWTKQNSIYVIFIIEIVVNDDDTIVKTKRTVLKVEGGGSLN